MIFVASLTLLLTLNLWLDEVLWAFYEGIRDLAAAIRKRRIPG